MDLEILQAEKSILLNKVQPLIELKKKLYSNVDISQPMSDHEKQLIFDIAAIFSDINKIVVQIKIIKRQNIVQGKIRRHHPDKKQIIMRLPSEKFSITYIIQELLSHEITEFVTPSEQKILKVVKELEKRKINYLCEKTETYTKIKIIRG